MKDFEDRTAEEKQKIEELLKSTEVNSSNRIRYRDRFTFLNGYWNQRIRDTFWRFDSSRYRAED